MAARPERLRKRRDFLKVQKGRRASTGLFSIQAIDGPDGRTRIGFTVSKKVQPSAVKRNRIRRRLREAARLEAAGLEALRADLVVVARPAALTAEFAALRRELREAAARAAWPAQTAGSSGRPSGGRRTDRTSDDGGGRDAAR